MACCKSTVASRIALKSIVTFILIGCCCSSLLAERPPNIVLIMADDVGWECFGSYGAEDYTTPNLDSLASKGLRFSHCYSQPICTPSRVQIMTGKYNFRNYSHFGYLHPKEKTFAHALRAAGYNTSIAVKWQLNGLSHNAEGNQDRNRPNAAGFDEYCLWQLTIPRSGSERFWSPALECNGKVLSKADNDGLYGPDIMSDFLCDFMERSGDTPFLVYYPSVLVHDPFVPTPDTAGDRERSHELNKQPKDPKARKENFVAMVNYLDQIVGKIVSKLEQINQLDNTIILFTADNGTNVGITSNWQDIKVRGGKGGTTDTGTHVPLIAYWKGHTPEGRVINDLIDFSDFLPTMVDAANATHNIEQQVDGISFLPQLEGKKGTPRNWVFCHYQPYWGKFKGTQFVRNQHYKLYRDESFFDIGQDMFEKAPLSSSLDPDAAAARSMFDSAFKLLPPAPPIDGGRDATSRPLHPTWPAVKPN